MKNNIVYGIVVFCVFMLLTYVLRLMSGKFPEETILWGVYKASDLLMGVGVALVLIYSRHMKKKSSDK